MNIPGTTTRWIAIAERGIDLAVAEGATRTAPETASVEPARPFPVAVTARTSAPKLADRLTFDVASIRGATVDWTLHAHRHVFAGYEEFAFDGGTGDDDEIVADGTGTTDALGNLAIAARDGSA